MSLRREVLRGRGLLVSRRTGTEYEVAYRFDLTIKVVEAPGKPPAESMFEARGSVKTLDSVMLPNEHYNLFAPEATYHVWRDEERWHIER
jgi:hypothetical protein